MRCEVAERELSARLDDAGDRRLDRSLEEHVASCPRCRAFAAGARRLRDAGRLRLAEPVPDLVPQIMAAVRGEARARPRPGRSIAAAPGWTRYAAAFVAAAVVAAVAVGGLDVRRGVAPALAADIPDRVAAASTEVTAYRVTFAVTERNFHPRVPRRTFTAEVTFRAPERFLAVVSDRTTYPPGTWPRNDLRLAIDGSRWLLREPLTCPRRSLPACLPSGKMTRSVQGREPFDGDALVPTDIVLPVRTLVGSDRVRVLGEGEVLERPTVAVELAYRDAVPLFGFLQAGGAWRPFFPHDRVVVHLDAASWFPLAYEVFAYPAWERERWAAGNGLPREPSDRALLEVRATSLETSSPLGFRPVARIPAAAVDEGFRDAPFGSVAADAVVPAHLAGLRPYRAGTFAASGRPADELLLSYTKGLAWLKIRQTRSWRGPGLFGDVGELAAPVRLPGGGTAYYEPATASLGRRLSVHARGLDVYLETNLPRGELFRVAASLPATGVPAPRRWLEAAGPGGVPHRRVDLAEAARKLPGLLLPSEVPPGYRVWAVELIGAGRGTAVTVHYRRPGAELDGAGIALHQAPVGSLAPPLEPDVFVVRVRGITGRYSPSRGQLEWVESGTYRSLEGTALDLAGLLRLASSLEPAFGRLGP
ncbi:MAG TPA: hypothetical protein VHL78_00060 [Actinomycetota bacterium]|nr:hypothetical protein [Actinomycetota bacterium]